MWDRDAGGVPPPSEAEYNQPESVPAFQYQQPPAPLHPDYRQEWHINHRLSHLRSISVEQCFIMHASPCFHPSEYQLTFEEKSDNARPILAAGWCLG